MITGVLAKLTVADAQRALKVMSSSVGKRYTNVSFALSSRLQ